jgi:hypothetical protein
MCELAGPGADYFLNSGSWIGRVPKCQSWRQFTPFRASLVLYGLGDELLDGLGVSDSLLSVGSVFSNRVTGLGLYLALIFVLPVLFFFGFVFMDSSAWP